MDPEARAAFDALVQRRYADLRRTAYRLTGNWATAEDLVQTSLVKTWRSGIGCATRVRVRPTPAR